MTDKSKGASHKTATNPVAEKNNVLKRNMREGVIQNFLHYYSGREKSAELTGNLLKSLAYFNDHVEEDAVFTAKEVNATVMFVCAFLDNIVDPKPFQSPFDVENFFYEEAMHFKEEADIVKHAMLNNGLTPSADE